MTFDDFESLARAHWERIPEVYRGGVDGMVVRRGARAHPSLADVYTLGECLTENYPSPFGGPDTTRSHVVLYYGSFWRLSRLDREFDWEGELWETLTHELQHHLESLASEAGLEDVDYAADENFRREQGEPFDPFFYRAAEPLGEGWFRIEDAYFLEVGDAGVAELEWRGAVYRVNVPEESADVLFVELDGIDEPPAALTLVRVRTERWRTRIARVLRREALRTASVIADAELLHAEGEA